MLFVLILIDNTVEYIRFLGIDETVRTDFYTHSQSGGFIQLVLDGDHLWALKREQVFCFDLKSPESPGVIKWLELPFDADHFNVADGFAYIVGDGMLYIYNVDPPNLAYLVNTVPMHYTNAIPTIVNGYLYARKDIFDIDPPESAHLVNTHDIAIGNCKLWGNWMVASSKGAIRFFDISDPVNPVVVHSLPTDAYHADFRILDDNLYIAQQQFGFSVADIDPVESAHIFKTFTTNIYGPVAVDGNALYRLSQNDNLYAYDISTPELMYVSEFYEDIEGGQIMFHDGFVYIFLNNDMEIYDLSSPGYLDFVGAIDSLYVNSEFVFDDDWLYSLGTFYNGYSSQGNLSVRDISNPSETEFLGQFQTLDSYGVFGADGTTALFYGSYNDGTEKVTNLVLISMEDPEIPEIMGEIPGDTFDYVEEIIVHDGYAYVDDDNEKIHVIDIDPPESMQIINTIYVSDARGLSIRDNKLYFMTNYQGLIEYDIADPENILFTNVWLDVAGWPDFKLHNEYAILYNENTPGTRVLKLW